jgi:hypothetical protein
MIVVRLSGGLGNQLLQYGFARHLARKNETELWIDASFYESEQLGGSRRYDLSFFNIYCQQVVNDNRFSESEFENLNVKMKYVREKFHTEVLSLEGWRQIAELGSNIILDGYWGLYNEHLFDEELAQLLRRELSLKEEISDAAFLNYKQMIEGSECPVAVHVRRGDYKNHADLFALCDEDYYRRAFAAVENRLASPNYFVFSDEIAWVRDNFKLPGRVHFVETNWHISDFELMRLCKHHIAANSTFSIGAAVLSENREKVVVLPAKYFNDPSLQFTYENLTQFWPGWLRV